MERAKWNVENLNIAIIGTDGKSVRKLAWIKTGSGGIYAGVPSIGGISTKLSYHANGEVYNEMNFSESIKRQLASKGQLTPARPPLKYPSIPNLKGFVPFYACGVGWHEYIPVFPFENVDAAVYVDVRHKGGVSFNLGLLEPNAFQFLNFRHFYNPQIHIIGKTKPWIVIWTYEPKPRMQPTWMTKAAVIKCRKCRNPLFIERLQSDQAKMDYARCDVCGFQITTEICSKCENGIIVQTYEPMNPLTREEPRRIVKGEECRGRDAYGKGCGWTHDIGSTISSTPQKNTA